MKTDIAIDTVKRINSLVSSSMGVGEYGSDPLEELEVRERQFYGSQARQIRRGLDIIQRIIDAPVDDGLRGEIKITSNYDEFGIGQIAYERLEELDIRNVLRQSGIDSRIYQKGSIIYPVIQTVGISSREDLANKLIRQDIEVVEKINVIPEDMFSFEVQNYDPLARGFGEIIGTYINGALINRSRIIHLIDDLDIYLLRGTPLLDRIYTACKALNIAEWTITQLILRYRALVVKYPAPKANQEDSTNWFGLQSLINDIKRKFTSKSVAAVPNTYDFEYLQTQFSGLKEATDFLFEYLSTVTRIPQSVIKGSAQGELASAKEDKRDYHSMVDAEIRNKKFKPVLNHMLDLILYEKGTELNSALVSNNIRPYDVVFNIEFEPLSVLSPLENAQKELIEVQTASLEIDKQISSPVQIQQRLFPEREMYEGGDVVPSDPFGLDSVLKDIQEKLINVN